LAAKDRAHAIDISHALPEAAAKHIDLSATRRKTLSWLALLSMIFGHAPIILPAVTGLRVNSAAAYDSLVLLHLSVFLHIAADLFEWVELRSSSGLYAKTSSLGLPAYPPRNTSKDAARPDR
jgi:hypothetical protein